MNEHLMRAVIESIVFLQLADEDTVDEDAAVRQTELIASRLSLLSSAERAIFSQFCAQQAAKEKSKARAKLIAKIPSGLGL